MGNIKGQTILKQLTRKSCVYITGERLTLFHVDAQEPQSAVTAKTKNTFSLP